MNYTQRRPTCDAIKINADTAATDFADWPGVIATSDGILFPTSGGSYLPAPDGFYLIATNAEPGYRSAHPEDFEREWEPSA